MGTRFVFKFRDIGQNFVILGMLSSALVAGLLVAETGLACERLQASGVEPKTVYEELMSPDSQLVSECLNLAAAGKANSTVQNALSLYFVFHADETANEPYRTQVESWLSSSIDTSVIDNFALAYGLSCEPTQCLLRETQFDKIKVKLLNSATERNWLQFRLSALVAKGIGFDSVLDANLASSNSYEQLLVNAFQVQAVGHFNEHVSTENATKFRQWLKYMVQSVQGKYAVVKGKSNLTSSDLLPLMLDLINIKTATDRSVAAAKKENLLILRNDRFATSQVNLGTSWKDIIEQIYPIYWDIIGRLNSNAITHDLSSMTRAEFDELFVSLLLNDVKTVKTPAQALAYLSFASYPTTVSLRVKTYMDDWSKAVANSFCMTDDPNCSISNSDLLVFASRNDKIEVSAADLSNIKNAMVSRNSNGYLNSYETLLDAMELADPFACGLGDHPLSNPCISLGTIIKKPLKPLFAAIKARYDLVGSGQGQTIAPINLLQLVNNYETAHAIAFEDGLTSTGNSFTQKFVSVALEKKVSLTQEYKNLAFLLNEDDHLHKAICNRMIIEPQWFPVKASVVDVHRMEWMTRNLFALNRLASLHKLYDEHGPLNWNNATDKNTLNAEFFNTVTNPVITPNTCMASEVDWVDMNDGYMQIMAGVQDYVYSSKSFMDRDLTDTYNRYDTNATGGIQ